MTEDYCKCGNGIDHGEACPRRAPARASVRVGDHEVSVSVLEVDGRPAVVLGASGDARLEGEEPGLYFVVSARETARRDHETECRSLAEDFARAAGALGRAFEDAEGDGFAIEAADGWPEWLPSFDEAALGLAGFDRDGFKVAEGR